MDAVAKYGWVRNTAPTPVSTYHSHVLRYEHLRAAFSDLRGQLIHLTGQDPLHEDHPLGALPIKVSNQILASSFIVSSLTCLHRTYPLCQVSVGG